MELENYKEGEIREMVELYESKGMSPADAMSIIRKMSKYPNFFCGCNDGRGAGDEETERTNRRAVPLLCFFPSLVGALLVSAPDFVCNCCYRPCTRSTRSSRMILLRWSLLATHLVSYCLF